MHNVGYIPLLLHNISYYWLTFPFLPRYTISCDPTETLMRREKSNMDNTNEIVLYQPDDAVRLEVMLDDDTVWLTQA
jgi:hypothetical protein